MKWFAFGSLQWGKPCFPHEPPSFKDLVRRAAYGRAPDEDVVEARE
jgi:hypothetical protein